MDPRVMPNGEIHYPRKGKEPPADVRGYKRKSENPASSDAWKFVPDIPDCKQRTLQLYTRGCGKVGVHIVCNLSKTGCLYENWNPCPNLDT